MVMGTNMEIMIALRILPPRQLHEILGKAMEKGVDLMPQGSKRETMGILRVRVLVAKANKVAEDRVATRVAVVRGMDSWNPHLSCPSIERHNHFECIN